MDPCCTRWQSSGGCWPTCCPPPYWDTTGKCQSILTHSFVILKIQFLFQVIQFKCLPNAYKKHFTELSNLISWVLEISKCNPLALSMYKLLRLLPRGMQVHQAEPQQGHGRLPASRLRAASARTHDAGSSLKWKSSPYKSTEKHSPLCRVHGPALLLCTGKAALAQHAARPQLQGPWRGQDGAGSTSACIHPWSRGSLAVSTKTNAHVRIKYQHFTNTNFSFSPFTNYPYFLSWEGKIKSYLFLRARPIKSVESSLPSLGLRGVPSALFGIQKRTDCGAVRLGQGLPAEDSTGPPRLPFWQNQ